MSDSTPMSGADGPVETETSERHPKHRRDDVPVDAEPTHSDSLLGEFGDNPDTSLAG